MIKIAIPILIFTLSTAHANLRPIISLAGGVNLTDVNMHQNITLISPFQNTYIGKEHNTVGVAGVFVGGEKQLRTNLLAQFGISYYNIAD